MRNVRKDGIVKNAFVLGLGACVAKVLGAIYRIPLTTMIGSIGLGLYQMVFPVYALLLDFSSGGAPGALAKLISSSSSEEKEKRAYDYLKTSYRLFSVLGIIFGVIIFIFAKPIARLQGNENAYLGYMLLAPAIFFVGLISCLRGYFQGLMEMKPIATSQIVEQSIKLVLGLTLAFIFRKKVFLAVAGAIFSITISELIAFFGLYSTYRKRKKQNNLFFTFEKSNIIFKIKQLIKYSFPIIVVGIIIPFSQVIDSFIIVKTLSKYTDKATSYYGLLSGAALTVINLPVSVCYGISTVAIPSVSKDGEVEEREKRVQKLLILTIVVAIPCALSCYLFAPLIVKILFGSLNGEERQITVNLLRILSPCIVLLSFLQTENAILIGKNKLYFPSLTLLIGITVKTFININLLNNPAYNIYGSAFGLIACYFVACLINLIMIFSLKVKDEYKILAIRQLKT